MGQFLAGAKVQIVGSNSMELLRFYDLKKTDE